MTHRKWNLRPVSEIADFLSGGTPRKSEPLFWSGDIPWISATSMHRERVSQSDRMVTPAAIGNGTRLARKGSTLVLVRGMSLLEEIRVCHATQDVAFNQDVKALVPRPGVDSWFLTYALLARESELMNAVHLAGHGTGVLATERLKGLIVGVPDLEEQRRIAAALGALDDSIENNSFTIRASESLLATKFAELKFDTAGGTRLGELLEINPAYPKPRGEAPYVDMAALPTDTYGIEAVGLRKATGGARFRNGDALLARITPCLENGKAAFVDCLETEAVAVGSTEFIVLRSKGSMAQSWPYFLARSDRFREYAIRHMSGTSGRQRLAAGSLGAYPIACPTEDAHADFAALCSPLFETMKSLREETQRLQQVRNELLPLLTSGRVRVRELERSV